MRPNSLDTLPMRQPNPVHQREVVRNLAAGTMSHEVELWHSDAVGRKLSEIDIERREVSGEPALEIHAPLTCNVVCYKEATNPSVKVVDNGRCEGIVRIDIPTKTIY